MTFQPHELAILAAFLFFILLTLASFTYACGERAGRIKGVQEMIADQMRAHAEHEAAKRAWFQK
jgi:hypothetical protein